MACRPQSNPSRTSSDEVPPELAFLGLRGSLLHTGQTGLWNRSDRFAQGIAGLERFDNLLRILAHSSVLARFCVNTLFGDSAGDQINLVLKLI